jgi:hypothetical protein
MYNSVLVASVIIAGTTLLSIGGLLLARKLVNFQSLRPAHDVGGYLLSVIGTLYAVLLGFVVVDAMQQYQHARQITEVEADTLTDVYVMARRLPEPKRSEIQTLCRHYVEQVIATEWTAMSQGNFCPLAREKAVNLMESLVSFTPQTETEKLLYPIMVQESSVFWQNRQARILSADNHLPLFEWIALVAGAVIVIVFTFFFGLENLKLQIIMTALLSILVSLNFSLLLFFAYPYNGDLMIRKRAFRSTESLFEKQAGDAADKPAGNESGS